MNRSNMHEIWWRYASMRILWSFYTSLAYIHGFANKFYVVLQSATAFDRIRNPLHAGNEIHMLKLLRRVP